MRKVVFGLILTVALSSAFSGCHKQGKAPSFSLPDLKDPQRTVTLEALTDRPVLLIFWATWCPSCVQEIEQLNAWHAEFDETDLKIVAINVEEDREKILMFEKDNPINYTVLLDESGEVAEAYDVYGLPVSVFLAKGGEIIYYGFGLPKDIRALLARD